MTPEIHTKGVRGFELDLHVTFRPAIPEAQALALLKPWADLVLELYRPHPQALRAAAKPQDDLPGPVIPSARLHGPLGDAGQRLQTIAELWPQLYGLELGLRGFLRDAKGQTEWMPWRRNVLVTAGAWERLRFEEGVKYVLER